MWEAQASTDRFTELVAWVTAHADPAGQIFASADEARVVVIATDVTELDEVPAEYVARPAHAWLFDKIRR